MADSGTHPGSMRFTVGLGFTLVLVLLIAIIGVGITQVEELNRNLDHIVNQLNVKKDLTERMSRHARERVLTLHRMFHFDDPFERDRLNLELSKQALAYMDNRRELMSMDLTAHEQRLIEQQFELTRSAVELQREVSDLLLMEDIDEANRTMLDGMIPAQNRVLVLLTELGDIQRKTAEQALANALKNQQQTRFQLLSMGLIAAFIGLLVAHFAIKRTATAERRLALEKERAEVSLRSIGDGIITTDAQGVIDYINPAGEQLSGWRLDEAQGRPLLEVFRAGQEGDDQPLVDSINRLMALRSSTDPSKRLQLFRPDRQPLHIEFTATVIQAEHGQMQGISVVFRDVSEMVEMARRLTHQVSHDSLTGLVNRREFEHRLQEAIDGARGGHEEHALCFIDLDKFKPINDLFGHAAGDELLRQLARLFCDHVRESDVVGRLGGDEFALLMQGCPLDRAQTIAEQLRAAVAAHQFSWEDKALSVGASIGLVPIEADGGDIGDIITAADKACYQAKHRGRDRVVVVDPDEAQTGKGAATGSRQLVEEALARNALQLGLQRLEALNGPHYPRMFEVLLRLRDSQGGELLPMSFIPTAGRYNLMPQLDLQVLRQTLELLGTHEQLNQAIFTINLSEQSLTHPGFAEQVLEALADAPGLAGNLGFEIPESAVLTRLTAVREFAQAMRDADCHIVFDDFGQAITAVSCLKQLPMDYLKLDANLVRKIVDDPVSRETAAAVHRIANVLGIRTVAKSVESDTALAAVKEIGIDYAQGFSISRPEPFMASSREAKPGYSVD